MYSLEFVTWTWQDSCLYVRILVFNFPSWRREYSITTRQAGSLSATTFMYSIFFVFLGFLILFFTVERKITVFLYQITKIFLVLYQKACWAETFFFLIPACTHAKSSLSCRTLCDPMDHSPPGPSIHRILQARILEWVAMPSSRGSSWPRDQTRICCVSWFGRCWCTESDTKWLSSSSATF